MTNKKPIEEPAHARFSPSAAKRWLACPGSIALSESAPPQPESKYAKEGTEAHTILENILKAHLTPGGNPYIAIRELRKNYSDQTMVEHVVNTFETIKTLIPHNNCEVLSETKSKCDFIHAEFGGTADAVIMEPFGRLTVVDFKYGAGVAVEAHNNEQMASYALGIAHKYGFDFTDCEMVIIQPRAEHRDGPVRSWRISIEELKSWETKFRSGIEAALDPINPKLIAGDHCRWCPAKPICPEVSTRALARARVEFSPIEGELKLPKISGIQVPHLGPTLDALERLEVWGEAVREHAVHVLERGEKIEGWVLTDKRANRKWNHEVQCATQAKKLFGAKVFETKLLSPAKLEERFPRATKWVKDHTVSVSSGVTLAREPIYKQVHFSPIVDEVTPKLRKGGSMPKKKPKRAAITKKRAPKKKTTKKRKR